MSRVSRRPPDRADIVIIGGGIVGCSVAYHLTARGVTDVVLLERRELTSGTTWHAAGLVPQLRATKNLTQLAKYTGDLYERLEEETGFATGFRRNGSVALATNGERLEELLRGASMARAFGCRVDVLEPKQVRKHFPLARVEDVVGGIALPEDGTTNPVDTTMALARGARARGAALIEDTKVTEIIADGGRVRGVRTHAGDIEAKVVVNCAGMWARELGATAGSHVPLHAAEHFYVVTEPVPGVDGTVLPTLRDPDGCLYARTEPGGKLLVGFFEPVAKPWGQDGIPEDFSFGRLAEDWQHLEPQLEAMLHRFPQLENVGIELFFNGPESFTPDDRYLIGEAPEVDGLFVAAGFNSIGIQSAGGVGKVLGDWIVDGAPTVDVWDVDIARMMPFQTSSTYLRERTTEGLGLLYAMHWPHRQPETARPVRTSPLHGRLERRGACFGVVAGWERANWFAPEGALAKYEYSYGRANWWEHSALEHRAARESVALFDQSSFAKHLVQGCDATAILGRLCANDIDVDIGRVVYTQWLNERGGVEADLTVTRLDTNVYLVVGYCGSQIKDATWLRRQTPEAAFVTVTDATSAYAVLGVMGPESRTLLHRVSEADFSNEAFPFGTSREIPIAYARARASRITYVGSLGWELYVPTEMAAAVFDALLDAGRDLELRLAGYHAMGSLRMEKAYREWGHDITPEDTPLESGLGFAVAWDKPGGFLGRESLIEQRERGLPRRLVGFVLDDPTPLLHHDEPIWRNGALVGRITSGAYGHTVRRSLGLGYVESAEAVTRDWVLDGSYEIEVACQRYSAQPTLRPFFDPRRREILV